MSIKKFYQPLRGSFYQQDNIGLAKYVISYYNGKKHPDGSDFYDIEIFSNKRDLEAFRQKLLTQGYAE